VIPKRKTEAGEAPTRNRFVPKTSKRITGLPKHRDWYRNLFETAPDCIYVISAEDRAIELLNPAFERMTGWSCSEWIGKSFAQLIHDNDLAAALKSFHQLLLGETPPPLELRFLTSSGQYLIGEATGAPHIENGRVIGIFGYVRDITERKNVEDELRKREMQLGEVQQVAHIGSWDVEISTNRVTWSDELYRIYGLRPQEVEITYEDFLQRVHTDDRKFVQKVFLKAFRDRKPFSFDHRIVQPDGTQRTLYTRGAFVADKTGALSRMLGIALDITERRRIEQALLESEKRYRDLFENVPIGIYRTTPDGRILMTNPALVQMLGYSSYDELALHNLDAERSEPTYSRSEFKNILEEKGEITGLEAAWIKRDGQMVFMRENAKAIRGEDGTISYYEGTVEDITERKRAAEALKKSEQQYRSLVETSSEIIWSLDTKGYWTFVNQAARWIYGYEPEEMIGRHFTDFETPEQAKRDLETFKRTMAGEPIFLYETVHKRKDGTPVILCCNAIVMRDEQGRVIGATGTAVDITKSKHVEQALRESEERFRKLFEDSPIGIYRTTPAGQTLLANPALVRMLGYSSFEELASRDLEDEVMGATYPRSLFKEMIEQEGRIVGLEAAWMRRDGERIFVRENARAIRGEDGEILYYEGTVEDITENKLAEEAMRTSEERFSKAFNASPHSMSISTLEEARFVDVNDTFLSNTGYARDEIIGHTAFELGLWPESEFRAKALKVIKSKAAIRDLEISFRTKDREVRIALLSLEIIKLGDKQYLLVAANDITERKLAEEQLKSSREQLRALSVHLQSVREEERIRLAREVHDEMGGALTSLKLDLSWLDNRLSEQQLKNKIAFMSKLIDTSVQMVRRISGELRPPVLDDFGLTAAIEWEIQEFHNRTGIKCEFISEPEDIALDPNLSTAVFRIFQEAMTNVARHANASKVKVSLKQAQSYLRLKIKDTGRGIRKSEIANPRSLGIIGIRERVLPWGGTVSISGVPGKGTDVTVQIPIRRRSDKERAGHMMFKKERNRRNSDRN
jgi:PAS domain S-box-containing protein